MEHYHYTKKLGQVWTEAVQKYKQGNREPNTYFTSEQLDFLRGIGLKVMDVYDYVEDYCNGGEPDFATFIAVHDIRRAYFLEVQNGAMPESEIDMGELPPKDQEVDGIAWLPRLLPKARAKLRGECPPDLMYGCGGDRKFFRTNNIHSAEFLRLVWEQGEDDQAVIDWVQQRRKTASEPVQA